MAYEHPILNIPGLTCNADFSAKQYFCATMTTTDKQVAVCSTAGEYVLGVIQNDPDASGLPVTIMSMGVTRVSAGGTLTAGDFWGTDGSGEAVKIEGTNTGADIGEYAMGVVLTGAADGEIATVTIGHFAHLVEAA